MKPTIEILENINNNSYKNNDEIFTRIYRYLLRPDIYLVAYNKLYRNNGASTKGINDDTADGFGFEKINNIIEMLSDESYQPKPSRRTYIKKENRNKLRPLGIPTFTDKLIQECMRMILEAIYEPVFLDCSHGFRPNRSCHTALTSIKHKFHGNRWFIEGDIEACFDNINHKVLIKLVNKKIKDKRFIDLINKFLKAGYMEDWKYNITYSGTPQGGIISPILANIYLHELDIFMEKIKQETYRPAEKRYNDDYNRLRVKVEVIRRSLKKKKGEERKKSIEELKITRKKMLMTPAKSQTDKVVQYVRYADDFLIGVNGEKEECLEIKEKISMFLMNELDMKLSESKTLITHSQEKAFFLGYNISIRRSNKIKPGGSGFTQRTLSGTVALECPLQDKIMPYLFMKRVIQQKRNGEIEPVKRGMLINLTDLEIITVYNEEIRGICNYYNLASNFYKLNYFVSVK